MHSLVVVFSIVFSTAFPHAFCNPPRALDSDTKRMEDIMLEVSCSTQTAAAYRLSCVDVDDSTVEIKADSAGMHDAPVLALKISKLRKTRQPLLIHSSTANLPTVMMALYLVSVTVLECHSYVLLLTVLYSY